MCPQLNDTTDMLALFDTHATLHFIFMRHSFFRADAVEDAVEDAESSEEKKEREDLELVKALDDLAKQLKASEGAINNKSEKENENKETTVIGESSLVTLSALLCLLLCVVYARLDAHMPFIPPFKSCLSLG